MTAMRKRAEAHETKFAHEQDLMFRAEARRNALIGLWAAAVMQSPAAEDYARDIVATGVENPGGVLDRLHRDFDEAGVIFLEDDVRARMTALLRQVADDMYAA